MKVILNEDIKGIGKKDEIVEVSNGYANNFLLPKKKAKEVNSKNMSELNSKNNAKEYKKSQEEEKAKKLCDELNKITLNIKVKAGANGKLFGGVSTKEIASELEKQYKIVIDKKKIDLKNPIKQLGITNIEIKLYENIIAKLKVQLLEG